MSHLPWGRCELVLRPPEEAVPTPIPPRTPEEMRAFNDAVRERRARSACR